METLQTLCIKKLASILLEGKDAQLELLPDFIAVQLLQELSKSVAATRQQTQISHALARALLTWLQRRPLHELILGKGKPGKVEQCAEKSLALLGSPSRGFSCFSALQVLCISHSAGLRDDDLAVLRTSRLQTLQLHECPCLDGSFIRFMSGSVGQTLRRLLCKNCAGIADRPVCKGLGELCLNQLSFSGSVRLTDEVLALLTGGAAPSPVPRTSSSLTHLDLSQTVITDQGALSLARLESLSCLALSRTNVSQGVLRELSKHLGLKPLMPNRPKVLLRSFAVASELEAEIQPAWAHVAPAALDPQSSQVVLGGMGVGSSDICVWPEAAVRHAAALLLFQTLLSGQKRPAGQESVRARKDARSPELQCHDPPAG